MYTDLKWAHDYKFKYNPADTFLKKDRLTDTIFGPSWFLWDAPFKDLWNMRPKRRVCNVQMQRSMVPKKMQYYYISYTKLM